LGSCASKKITDVSYLFFERQHNSGAEDEHFMPRNSKLKQLPVLIFVHGGYWNSGRKGTYDLLGRNFARKGVVVVIRIIL
jgi:acetyl esterase/lipase